MIYLTKIQNDILKALDKGEAVKGSYDDTYVYFTINGYVGYKVLRKKFFINLENLTENQGVKKAFENAANYPVQIDKHEDMNGKLCTVFKNEEDSLYYINNKFCKDVEKIKNQVVKYYVRDLQTFSGTIYGKSAVFAQIGDLNEGVLFIPIHPQI